MGDKSVGQVYTRDDGARVQVDHVGDGQVYFVSWKPSQEVGCPIRMTVDLFHEAILKEGMSCAE